MTNPGSKPMLHGSDKSPEKKLTLCMPGRGPSGPGGVAPAGARSPTPGLRRPRLAGPRPRLLLSPSRSRSERRRRHASSRGAPLGTVRPRTVTRTKACDPSAAASALPLGRPPPREKHLPVTRRPTLASRPGPVSTRRRTGARIRTPLAGRPPGPDMPHGCNKPWLMNKANRL